MKAALVLRLGEAEVPATSDAIPISPSTPVYMQEELTLAAWEASPKLVPELVLPELRKARSCSHCVLEIGHWFVTTMALSAPLTELHDAWLAPNFPFRLVNKRVTMQFIAFINCMPLHIAMCAKRPLLLTISFVPIRIGVSFGIGVHSHCNRSW